MSGSVEFPKEENESLAPALEAMAVEKETESRSLLRRL